MAQAACQPPALSRRAVAGLARRVRPLAGLEATTSPRRCRDGQCPLLGGSKPESSHQYKARRNRYALGRARRALAPRPALRATVARRLRSSRARPAVAQRPRGSSPDPDHLGSPETISDDQGAAFHQHFDPFGKPIAPASPELTRVGFTGHDHDNDLGLIDMKGRVYDPLAGRFMTADPVTQAPFWSQGLNRYSYVFNNPINNTDPSGFSADGDWSGVGATAWGGAVTGMAALSGFGVGAGAIAGGLGIGAMNPLGTALLGIGEGSAGSTHAGIAPTTAPKGSGGATAGAKVNVTGTKELAPPDTTIPDVFRGDEGKVACYPACSTDPDAAFGPNKGAANAYKKSYMIVAQVILASDLLVRLGTWVGGRAAVGAGERLFWGFWKDYPKVVEAGREYAQIGQRLYTEHAVGRMLPTAMGGRGIAPAFVEAAIQTGSRITQVVNGVTRTIFTSGNVQVVTEQGGRLVVTVMRVGGP